MARKVGHSIQDILEMIERVQTKVAGRTFAEFQADWEFQFVVQRAVEIISEATRRLPDELKATQPQIHWRRAAGIGSVLRHDYHSIADKVIWDVVHEELPALKEAIKVIAVTLDE